MGFLWRSSGIRLEVTTAELLNDADGGGIDLLTAGTLDGKADMSTTGPPYIQNVIIIIIALYSGKCQDVGQGGTSAIAYYGLL